MARLVVCLPFYNEQDNVSFVITGLKASLATIDVHYSEATIICADDASTDSTLDRLLAEEKLLSLTNSISSKINIKILRINQNGGHQRALWYALLTAQAEKPNFIICMDGDGQDDPKAIGAMIELLKQQNCQTVFASRSKRAESPGWRLGYHVYQSFTKILIGRSLPFGNFSAFTPAVLAAVIRQGTFSHLAATLAASRYPYQTIAVPRLSRHAGSSKMRLLSLADYGIAALTTFPEAWTRLFSRIAIWTFLVCAVMTTVVMFLKFFTSYAYPGWASTVVVGGAILTLQSIGFLVCFAFLSRIMNFLQRAFEKNNDIQPFTVISSSNLDEKSALATEMNSKKKLRAS